MAIMSAAARDDARHRTGHRHRNARENPVGVLAMPFASRVAPASC
jgi:hypothetical protein